MTSTPIENRYDFVLLFDVQDGNPNGDPDNANLPRLDAQTGEGLVTDVCLKRKIRNYVSLTRELQSPYNVYVTERAILEDKAGEAYKALGLGTGEAAEDAEDVSSKGKKPKKDKRADADVADKARAWMCQNYYDIRTFGAVMSLKKFNAGQVRGPVQLTFSRSIGPVLASEHALTRMAVATNEEAEKQGGDNRTMGRKNTVPYGLYRAHGFISAPLAAQTGFSADDLSLLWEAIENMFEHDRSAARGLMSVRGLYIFKHDSKYGNVPAHALFERITIERVKDVPRQFADFRITINRANLPEEVELIERAVSKPQKAAA